MSLETTTQDFWDISLAYHNRLEADDIEVGVAIYMLREHLLELTSRRLITKRIIRLSSDIICGNNKRHG